MSEEEKKIKMNSLHVPELLSSAPVPGILANIFFYLFGSCVHKFFYIISFLFLRLCFKWQKYKAFLFTISLVQSLHVPSFYLNFKSGACLCFCLKHFFSLAYRMSHAENQSAAAGHERDDIQAKHAAVVTKQMSLLVTIAN